jgi:hypothetical protein
LGPSSTDGEPAETPAAVIARHGDALLARRGVLGLAEGTCDGLPAIVILVEGTADRGSLPTRLEGFTVIVRETGSLSAPPRA